MANTRDRDYPRRVSKRDLDIEPDEITHRSRRRMARVNLFGQKESKGLEGEDPAMKILKAYESQQIKDPFSMQYTNTVYATGVNNILPPPYNPYALMRFPLENNTLRQCIDAMVINIEAMGHRFEYVGEPGGEESDEAMAEKGRLESLVSQPNGEYGLLELRERRRRDFETFGYCYLELCRGTYKNDIVSFYHVPAETVRLTAADAEETEAMVWLFRDGQYVQQKIKRRFRRFVQEIGTRRVYFKEFADPRPIDSTTGRPYDGVDQTKLATELVFTNLYSPGSPYGMPRYINQLPAIMGSRESELTNLQFFKENAIPAMAVLVSGGHLTADSVDEIEEHIYSVQGRSAQHRVMILEADGDHTAAGPDKTIPAPKITLMPLTHDRQTDGLFQEYDKNNSAKVRSSFRLSPMLLGMSQDVTYAVAEASLVVAEGQVFGPERNKTDDIFNNQLLTDAEGKPPMFWRFRSQAARITDPQMVINAMITFDRVGALTPNVTIGIANELFDLSIPPIDEPWGNHPFDITIGLLRQGQLAGMDELLPVLNAITNPNVAPAPGWPALGPGSESPPGVTKAQRKLVNKHLVQPLQRLIEAAGLEDYGYRERSRSAVKTETPVLKKKFKIRTDQKHKKVVAAKGRLAKNVSAVLKRMKTDVKKQLKTKLKFKAKKDSSDDADRLALLISLSELNGVDDAVNEDLTTIAIQSGQLTIDQAGLADEGLIQGVNDAAAEWADTRSADLVTMITDATRNDIRSAIADGIENGLSEEEVTQNIMDSASFSEDRAAMIAETETTTAVNQGALSALGEMEDNTGLQSFKEWSCSGNACEDCQANQDAGPIPIDEPFPSGDDAPAAHPNCACDLIGSQEDPEE